MTQPRSITLKVRLEMTPGTYTPEEVRKAVAETLYDKIDRDTLTGPTDTADVMAIHIEQLEDHA